MDVIAWMFGVMGFLMAASAISKIKKLEAELKRRGLLDEKFTSEK